MKKILELRKKENYTRKKNDKIKKKKKETKFEERKINKE